SLSIHSRTTDGAVVSPVCRSSVTSPQLLTGKPPVLATTVISLIVPLRNAGMFGSGGYPVYFTIGLGGGTGLGQPVSAVSAIAHSPAIAAHRMILRRVKCFCAVMVCASRCYRTIVRQGMNRSGQ